MEPWKAELERQPKTREMAQLLKAPAVEVWGPEVESRQLYKSWVRRSMSLSLALGVGLGNTRGLAAWWFNERPCCLRVIRWREINRIPNASDLQTCNALSIHVSTLAWDTQRRKKKGKMDLWNSTRFRQTGLLGHGKKGWSGTPWEGTPNYHMRLSTVTGRAPHYKWYLWSAYVKTHTWKMSMGQSSLEGKSGSSI